MTLRSVIAVCCERSISGTTNLFLERSVCQSGCLVCVLVGMKDGRSCRCAGGVGVGMGRTRGERVMGGKGVGSVQQIRVDRQRSVISVVT